VTQEKDYLLSLLVHNRSLYDLLDMLAEICKNVDFRVSQKTKSFKGLRLTLFGLLVKLNGTISFILLRTEFLKNQYPKLGELHSKFYRLKNELAQAQALLADNRVQQAKEKIMSAADYYLPCYDTVNAAARKYFKGRGC